MPLTNCPTCQSVMDAADNFCRYCGAAIGHTNLPVKSNPSPMTLWKPQASPVVKGAAVMAAGTLGQFVVRRAIGSLIGGGGGKRRRRSLFPTRRQDDGLLDEAQIITETVTLRRVRIRRQA